MLTCEGQIAEDLDREWFFLSPTERQKYEYRASFLQPDIAELQLQLPGIGSHLEKYHVASGAFWLYFYQSSFNNTAEVPGTLMLCCKFCHMSVC